jgi:hypothetical protein
MVNELLRSEAIDDKECREIEEKKGKVSKQRKAEDTSTASAILKEARRDLALSRGDFLSTAPSIHRGRDSMSIG